jgi:flagellar secretion chaperone FliS
MRTNLAYSAYSAYSQNNISIESPEKLIQMLFEGILKFTSQAKKAIEDNDIEKRVYWINRTSAIFAELINSLQFNEGGVAHYLNGLYTQQLKLLAQSNMNNDIEPLDEVLHVTKELLNLWNEETVFQDAVD